jgi:hypothetical protein
VTLLGIEAKYIAISEVVKEVKFVYYLLFDLQIKVNTSISVRADNIGAIFMSEYALPGFCPWHEHTRYRFVQEFIKEGFIKI